MSRPAVLGDAIAQLAAELSRTLSRPDYTRWLGQVRKTGGCARPIRLEGTVKTHDLATGALLHSFTADADRAVYAPCNNRRASRCPTCSHTYQGDTYQLIKAGLIGQDPGEGKDEVPAIVREHPRLFVTLTAPSFGPVHTRHERDGKVAPCRPRRDAKTCDHGHSHACTARHDVDDPALGQPICPACYDYTGHVLWHAHAGELWRRFMTALYRTVAGDLGISEKALRARVRISYAKVAEFQRRGAVHFHAIIRIDGRDPTDPDRILPPYGLPYDAEDLAAAITRAATHATLTIDYPPVGTLVLRWGTQVDTRTIAPNSDDGKEITEGQVAGYIAKYATKAAETTGTVDRPIRDDYELSHLPITDHARALIGTCWRLGGLDELAHLRLRAWAHMLGFRGHFTTKARRYSTTLGALRDVRARYRADPPTPRPTRPRHHARRRALARRRHRPHHPHRSPPSPTHRRHQTPGAPAGGRRKGLVMTSPVLARRWHTVAEVADMLGYGVSKTKMLIATGKIRSVKDGGHRRILPEWVDEYVAQVVEDSAA